MWGNSFIANRTQVKYVGTRHLEWSQDGRGNYWSDHLAFDVNGDGVADRPYRPNNLVDQLIWRYPVAKILINSPVLQILQWAQSQFPALYPGGVIDSTPLMHALQCLPCQRMDDLPFRTFGGSWLWRQLFSQGYFCAGPDRAGARGADATH